MTRVFPELKESEDERIRKALLEMVHDTTGDSLWVAYNVHKEDAIDWLEKQGDQDNNEDSNILQRFSFYSYKDEPNILYLAGLYVNEEYRNKGIGTKILEVADEVAKSLNCHAIRLKTKKGSDAERLYRTHGYNSLATKDKDEIWLEKQGNHSNFLSKIQVGDKVTRNEDGVLVNLSQLKRVAKKDEKQGEQKPVENKGMNLDEEEMTPFQKKVFCIIDTTIEEEQGLKQVCDELLALASNEIKQKHTEWSEEDEKMFHVINDSMKYLNSREARNKSLGIKLTFCQTYIQAINWFKSLKDRVQPQPKQEWSKKDDKMCQETIDWFEKKCFPYALESENPARESIKWLKSLKDRCNWKPSDEQMQTLYRYAEQNNYDGAVLTSLYNDIKKLK